MPASFITLVKQSFQVFWKNVVQIIAVAAVIALFSSIIESSLATVMARERQNLPINVEQPVKNGTGIIINTNGSSRDLQEDVNQRTDMVIKQLREDQALQLFFALLPRILFTYVAIVILSFLALVYYFVLALEGDIKPDWGMVFDRLPPLLFPMIGLYIWLFIRSFAWIPIVGILTSIYYFPRFVLSAVILADNQAGIRESAKLSMKLSHGYWWKIFSNAVGVAVILGIVLAGLSIIADVLGALTLSILGILFLHTWVNYLGIAYGTIFSTLLAKSVIAAATSRKK